MTAENTTRPAFKLFQIEERGEGSKAYWREVGVAWANKDSSLNLDFAVIPLIGTHTIQARPYVEKKAAEEEAPAPAPKGRKPKT